jgi:competence protein ComEA
MFRARVFKQLLLATAAAVWLACANAQNPVEVNTATVAELDSVVGIGPALSRKILEERSRAHFSDWADFMRRVPGIGLVKATKLSGDGLRVNGQGRDGKKPVDEPQK